MASLNQLISEMAHALGQPNNAALKENIKLLLMQTRNEVIRRSYENHNYVDKVLTQRFTVSLDTVSDGDIESITNMLPNVDIDTIKKTSQRVPRPVRLVNNLPFDRVSTAGYKTNVEIPFIKETTARFRCHVPGLKGMACYDYINGYIYVFDSYCKPFALDKIVVESAFENPTQIEIMNGLATEWEEELGTNEWLFSEDMIGQIKEIIYKRDLMETLRETNEHSINTEIV